MERILVGVDGSAASLDALRWATDIAHRSGASVTAARTFSPSDVESIFADDAALHEQQLRELERWCGELPEGSPAVQAVLLDGDPVDALPQAAVARRAELLVVGERGPDGFSHLHPGSIAHHLLHRTTVPTAVVPQSGSSPIGHLVVGVDGSEGCRGAVTTTAGLAASLEVEVTVVFAYEPFVEWVPESDPSGWRRTAEARVRTWAEPIAAANVPFDVVVDRSTHPVEAIARAMHARPGSVAVVGARGLGGFAGLRVGRVPLQLVHHTGAAVVVVPARGTEPA